MSFPSRTNRGSGLTCTSTYTSPARPPSAPACPSPETRMRWPSWIPAGTSTSIALATRRRAPRRGTRCTGARRSPRGRGNPGTPACGRTRRRGCARPDAGARSPRSADRAAAAFPARRRRRRTPCRSTATSNGTWTFAPRRCSDELDLDLRADVRPALLRGGARAAAEDVVAEERREEVAEAADVEVRRREAARAEPGVAVAVVERTASRSSRAPRTPRSPRGSGSPSPARSRRRDAARARAAGTPS